MIANNKKCKPKNWRLKFWNIRTENMYIEHKWYNMTAFNSVFLKKKKKPKSSHPFIWSIRFWHLKNQKTINSRTKDISIPNFQQFFTSTFLITISNCLFSYMIFYLQIYALFFSLVFIYLLHYQGSKTKDLSISPKFQFWSRFLHIYLFFLRQFENFYYS